MRTVSREVVAVVVGYRDVMAPDPEAVSVHPRPELVAVYQGVCHYSPNHWVIVPVGICVVDMASLDGDVVVGRGCRVVYVDIRPTPGHVSVDRAVQYLDVVSLDVHYAEYRPRRDACEPVDYDVVGGDIKALRGDGVARIDPDIQFAPHTCPGLVDGDVLVSRIRRVDSYRVGGPVRAGCYRGGYSGVVVCRGTRIPYGEVCHMSILSLYGEGNQKLYAWLDVSTGRSSSLLVMLSQFPVVWL